MAKRHVFGRESIQLVGVRRTRQSLDEIDANDRGGVMVWAGISTGGKTDLVIVVGNQTSQRYIDGILQPHVVPLTGNSYVLQDDNARPHREIIVQDFFGKNEWTMLEEDMMKILENTLHK